MSSLKEEASIQWQISPVKRILPVIVPENERKHLFVDMIRSAAGLHKLETILRNRFIYFKEHLWSFQAFFELLTKASMDEETVWLPPLIPVSRSEASVMKNISFFLFIKAILIIYNPGFPGSKSPHNPEHDFTWSIPCFCSREAQQLNSTKIGNILIFYWISVLQSFEYVQILKVKIGFPHSFCQWLYNHLSIERKWIICLQLQRWVWVLPHIIYSSWATRVDNKRMVILIEWHHSWLGTLILFSLVS